MHVSAHTPLVTPSFALFVVLSLWGLPVRFSNGTVLDAARVVLMGCKNDTDCWKNSGPWQCTPVSTGGSPCHVNGKQSDTPPYVWPWSRCACLPHTCQPLPPQPDGKLTYGCRSDRCIPVMHNGTSNSSTACEWATGCVPLAQNEWLADTAEFHLVANHTNESAIAKCIHANTFLKKSEQISSSLPTSEKLAIPLGTTIRLKNIPTGSLDGYALFECADSSICASPPAESENHRPKRTPRAVQDPISYLMIGDSISLGYLPGVQTLLNGTYNVVHSQGNAGNANNIAHNLDCYLAQVNNVSVITYNAGIHDLARGQEFLTASAYATLMTNITQRLVATKAAVLFVSTTPVPTNATDPLSPSVPEGILDADVRAYNKIATDIAVAHGATNVVDLHGVVTTHCGGVGYSTCALQRADNPHFLEEGWAVLASAVAQAVRSARMK
eukprot:m.128776 g.128776  ORF g.128776 m.128776 type:complete len:441 (-) comp17446_c0_seq1:1303-2625(-)